MEGGKESGIGEIHHEFSIKDGHWSWNMNSSNYEGNPDMKIMFLFNDNDIIKLNGC